MPNPTPATTEQFAVLNRWTRAVQFEATIEVTLDMLPRVKLGLAVRWGQSNGADLTDAVLRGADLTDAVLTGAVLTGAVLTGAVLRGADLTGAVLTGAVLTGAVLRGADLTDADLTGAVLTGADWIPKIENIHQRIYEAAAKEGALDMSAWHRTGYCGTTHCRAGWAVVLAGGGGRVLEGIYGTGTAAALIYQASDPTLERIPQWVDSNENALADMARLAGVEA